MFYFTSNFWVKIIFTPNFLDVIVHFFVHVALTNVKRYMFQFKYSLYVEINYWSFLFHIN